MTDQSPPFDEATLDALQARLYPRLRETLLEALREEREQVPPYYEQFIASEIQRVEEAIERNGQRIDELRTYVDARFEEVLRRNDQRIDELRAYMDVRFEQIEGRFEQIEGRFEQIERRLDEMNVRFRNWALASVAFLSLLITLLNFLFR
ncbi:MAG: hypothetical protein ACRDIB_09615 [Ardenticatenaceae bacterium]